MEKISINSILAIAGTALAYMLGKWDNPMIILIIFMGIDYITGVFYAITQQKVCSEIGFKGIAKKIAMLFLVAVGASLDRLTADGVWTFRTMVCYFYIANEGISILENAGNLGLPIPKKIREVLHQLTMESEEDIRKGE